jgi:hypothetical protein
MKKKTTRTLIAMLSCWFAILTLAILPVRASAIEYMLLSTPGVPGSFGLYEWPFYVYTQGGTSTFQNFTELAYYSKTGLTGTTRDQFEVWLGGNIGYQSTNGSSDSAWGGSQPQIGFEYYYNIIQPSASMGDPGYLSWWTSPYVSLIFPNGSSKASGFGSLADNYAYTFGWEHYLGIGKFTVTINPVFLTYNFRNQSWVDFGSGVLMRPRRGLSMTFADLAAGWMVSPTLFLGVHHDYMVNGMSNSDFGRSTEGQIGPTFTYTGFAKDNVYVLGALDFDYHHQGQPRSTTVSLLLYKSFK